MTFDLDVSSTFGVNFKILRHLVLEKLMFPRQPTRSHPPADGKCTMQHSSITASNISSRLSPPLTLFILHHEESQEGPTEKPDEFTFKPVGLKRIVM